MSYRAPLKDMLFDIEHLANIEQPEAFGRALAAFIDSAA